MITLLALVMLAICAGCGAVAVMRPNYLTIFLATQAAFTFGFFCLPVFFFELASFRYEPEQDIVVAQLMALGFFITMISGFVLAGSRVDKVKGLRFDDVDTLLQKYWWIGAIATNLFVIINDSTRTMSHYQTRSAEEFIAGQSIFVGLLSFIGGFARALAAIYFMQALSSRRASRIIFGAVGLIVQLYLALDAGNRNIFITPIFMFFAALVIGRKFRLAGTIMATAVAAILLVSPFAIALRSGSWNNSQDIQAKNFTYGDNPVMTMLQSIIDRADILGVTIVLKSYVDTHGHVSSQYFKSVLVVPIPNAIYKDKPTALSDNGLPEGESTILAWMLVNGRSTMGSLTAFGSIIAYREGGWIWMLINGFLAGGFIATLLTIFVRGGMIGQAFFVISLVNWAVHKVTPSLMEALVDVMTFLPIMAIIYAVNAVLRSVRLSTIGDNERQRQRTSFP